jgi:hypothetical protein
MNAFPKPTREDRKKANFDTRDLAFSKEHFDVDAKFRRFVTGHACVLSGHRNEECGGITEFAHITTGGLQRKGSDYFGVPLCSNHHTAGPGSYHRLGSVEAFDAAHGTNLWMENAAVLAAWVRRITK